MSERAPMPGMPHAMFGRRSALCAGLAIPATFLLPSQAASAMESRSVPRNTRLVLDALRVVFSEHRIDQVDVFFAEDFEQFSPYAPAGGRDVLRAWWAGFVDAVPDVTTTVSQAVGQGDDVATFRVVQGTVVHDLPDLGIVGRGQPLEFRAADVFRVKRRQIVAHWEVVDTGPLLQLAQTSH